ncbi:MAG: hypothetical protein R2856_23040 [Caldilineaceae bacterium]
MDSPTYVRYLRWMGNILEGDLAVRWSGNQPVSKLIADRLP